MYDMAKNNNILMDTAMTTILTYSSIATNINFEKIQENLVYGKSVEYSIELLVVFQLVTNTFYSSIFKDRVSCVYVLIEYITAVMSTAFAMALF